MVDDVRGYRLQIRKVKFEEKDIVVEQRSFLQREKHTIQYISTKNRSETFTFSPHDAAQQIFRNVLGYDARRRDRGCVSTHPLYLLLAS